MKMLNVSSSPHTHQMAAMPAARTKDLMLDVVIAMIPTTVYGIWQFGLHALLVVVATIAAAVLFEYWFEKICHKPITTGDFSAVVTGLILALNMPPEIPLWIPILGAFFAIVVVKQLYGGLGQNFMNPALAARCFLLISCAKFMTDFSSGCFGFDSASGPTPLASLKAGTGESLINLFTGRIPGTIGEVSKIALLIGAVYLLAKKVISWRIPVIYILTTALFCFIFGQQSLSYVMAEVLSGGLIFGAFFMATDYVTSPITPKGQIIFAVFLGVMTGLFRLFGPSSEGVSYAILLGNIIAPLIETATVPAAFGREKTGKKKKTAGEAIQS